MLRWRNVNLDSCSMCQRLRRVASVFEVIHAGEGMHEAPDLPRFTWDDVKNAEDQWEQSQRSDPSVDYDAEGRSEFLDYYSNLE